LRGIVSDEDGYDVDELGIERMATTTRGEDVRLFVYGAGRIPFGLVAPSAAETIHLTGPYSPKGHPPGNEIIRINGDIYRNDEMLATLYCRTFGEDLEITHVCAPGETVTALHHQDVDLFEDIP